MSLKTIRNITLILTLAIFAYGVGYQFGHRELSTPLFTSGNTNNFQKSNNTSSPNTSVDFTLFWDVWERLSQNFIKKEALDSQKMMYGAISGMVASLDDPYTVFLNPQQNKETKEELQGSFEGIGAQLGLKDKRIVVIAPLSGTPAEKAGIKPGDWILSIDGKMTDNLSLPEAVSKIRGPKGTKVALSILHEKAEKPVEMEIERDIILVKSVEISFKQQIVNGKNVNYAYLKLSKFGDDTDKEWDLAIDKIKLQEANGGLQGMILDLRNNPGGYLNGAVYVVSEFLNVGQVVVVQENANGSKQSYAVEREGKLIDMPLVVLMNKGSASASEIVAGALSDYGRAKLVGEKTFGKGSVQEAEELPGGAGLHVTTAKWLMPKGKWINGTGIEADIKVQMDEKNPEKDPQLERAVAELAK